MFKRSLPYIIFILLLASGSGLFPDSIQIKDTVLRADQLNKDGNPAAALQIYYDLLQQNPGMEYLYSKAGSAAYKSGENELARYYLEKADSVNLLSDSGKFSLGDVYLSLGEQGKAELTWRKLQNDPTMMTAEMYGRLVELDIQSDRWEQAKRDLESWSQANPENGKTHEYLGWVSLFIKPQDALRIFQDLDKSNGGTYQNIIDQISSYPDPEGGVNELSAWWIKMGDLLESAGKNEFSIKAYSKAIALAPDNSIGWARLALMKQKSNLDGRPEVEKAQRSGGNDPAVDMLIADFWQKDGKPELTLIYLHKAIEQDSKNTHALTAIGWLLSDIGNVDDGIGYIKQAAIILNSSEGWVNVIHYCLTNGIYLREEAIPAAREAVRISPDSPEVLDLAGQVFFSQDDLVTAERYFLKAVSLQGDFYAAHLHLAYLYIRQGYYDLARDHLKTAIEQLESPDIREKAIQAYAKLPVE